MCARFGRMVASVDPAVTSAATACVVRSRDVAARTACASPRRCVRPSGGRRRRSGTATTGTWRLATQQASGAAIRIASPMLAGRRVAAQHSRMRRWISRDSPSGSASFTSGSAWSRWKPQDNGDPFALLTLGKCLGIDRRRADLVESARMRRQRQAALASGPSHLPSPRRPGRSSPDPRGRDASAQGQGGFREYGVPKTAASVADGSSLRTTTSIASPERSTRVKSRYRP